MGENEFSGELFVDANGNYEKIGEIQEMRISVDVASGINKTVAVLAAIDKAGKAFVLTARATSKATTALRSFVKTTVCIYPNKRVVWLALHHKKHRVRKKNTNRILKSYKKEGLL